MSTLASDFASIAASLPGEHGLAVSAIGRGQPVELAGTLQTAEAWSTAKVPLAMAVLAAGLGPSLAGDVEAAVTTSDNEAAERLWDALGGGEAAAEAVTAQLRVAGDLETVVEAQRVRPPYTAFGQTTWSLGAQARFVAGMGATEPGAAVLDLMARVAADQRWGLGTVDPEARLKGGWGPDPSVDRQMGIVSVRGSPLAVAILTRPADGSHETGMRNLDALAGALA